MLVLLTILLLGFHIYFCHTAYFEDKVPGKILLISFILLLILLSTVLTDTFFCFVASDAAAI